MQYTSRADIGEVTLTRDPIFLLQRRDGKGWKTERVFGTDGEAKQWIQQRADDYKDGVRVYCVPCEGSLAKLLRDTDYHG